MTVIPFPSIARPRTIANGPFQSAAVEEAFRRIDAALDDVAKQFGISRSDLQIWMTCELLTELSRGTDHDDPGEPA